MPLLDITTTKKITATVALEESTAQMVDQYAAFLKVPADDVVNKALEYVFSKDREFQQFREKNGEARAPHSLRVKKTADAAVGGKRGRRAALSMAS